MKDQPILPLLLLSLTASFAAPAPAQTLPTVVVATVPSSPAPGDSIVLSLSGQWPDGCIPEASRTSLTKEGSALRVHFRVLVRSTIIYALENTRPGHFYTLSAAKRCFET